MRNLTKDDARRQERFRSRRAELHGPAGDCAGVIHERLLGIKHRVEVMSVDDIGTTMHGFVQNASTEKYRSSARPRSTGLMILAKLSDSTSTRTGNTDGFVAEVAVAGHSEL